MTETSPSVPPLDTLPLCPPSATVAIAGASEVGRQALRAHYERLGASVVAATQVQRDADLVMVAGATREEIIAAERAVKPGGTLLVVGELGPGATLPATDLVLAEVDVLFAEAASR